MRVEEKWVIKDSIENVFIAHEWTFSNTKINALKFDTFKAANSSVHQHIMPNERTRFKLMKVKFTSEVLVTKEVDLDENAYS